MRGFSDDSISRTRLSRLVGVGTLGAAAVLAMATPATADASGGLDPTSPGIHYALVDRACSDAAPGGAATCFAEQRVQVAQGTAGAEPFTIGAGYATGPAGGYTPADLLTAYGLTGLPANAGSGQTVAVVDAYDDPNALSDLNAFDLHYGLPTETAATFAKLNQNGAASPLPSADTTGWSEEESLDVDAVRAICHQCKILLIETTDNFNNNLQAGVAAAVAAGATEVSNSYGGAETGATTSPYNYPGVVITASTGDNGWYGWDNYDSGASSDGMPEAPASLPNVIAVGGTSLTLNADATRNTEAVWNEDGPEDTQFSAHNTSGASGGGCSKTFTAQAWQSHIAGFSNTGCGTNRLAADVSALADPDTGFDVYDTDHFTATAPNGWATFGGTSLSSPLVAAMWALAGGAQGVSYPSLTLYGHANTSGTAFYDVTKGYATFSGVSATGGNDWCDGDVAATCKTVTQNKKGNSNPNGLGKGMLACALDSSGNAVAASTQCTATTGFDGPSGVGTPTGLIDFAPMKPSPSFTAPTGVHTGVSTAFSGSATDPFPGGTISSYSWSWGDGTSATTGASPSHTYAAAGTYTVTLTATDNYSQVGTVSHTVSVGTPPTVTAISPTSGPASGGTSVTITGTTFTGATAVTFGGTAASSLVVNSATQITATAPAGSAGTVDVTVTTPGGVSATSSADQFTYLAAPVVTSVSPNTGPTTGGTSVTITGSGFTGATAVAFGSTAASTFTVNSPTQITATSPAHAAGAVDVTVTTPNGTSASGAPDVFTYVLLTPSVTSVSPSTGSTAGGTSVTITGTNLTGATAVTFGSTAASTFTVNSPTQITATSPAEAAGAVDVTVTTPNGTSASGAPDVFTYVVLTPSVTSVSPSTGSTAGGTSVTITGTNFTGVSAVTFGSTAASGFTVDSATQITAVAPLHAAGGVDVRVTTTAGGQSGVVASDQYTYAESAPAVTGVSPAQGSTAGGDTVMVTGSGFTGTMSVKIGGVAATNVTVLDDFTITVTSPPHAAGNAAVQVKTPLGLSPTNPADLFKYVVPPPPVPTVSAISPAQGSTAGGAIVTVTGTDLTGATAVKFGGVSATNVVVVNNTTLTAKSPAHAAGNAAVQVTTAGGTSATNPSDLFKYVAGPGVTGVSPAQGSTAGGDTVMVTGFGFTGATGVKFGGVAGTNVVVLDDSTITVKSPAHAAGNAAVQVTAGGLTSPTNPADLFKYVVPPPPAPTVSGVSPAQGSTAGGDTVTVTGTGFTGATGVKFGGVAATNIMVINDTTLTVTSPTHAAGNVAVQVTTAGGTSATNPADRYKYV